jgi:predicted small lipoprotein YifL
MGNPGFLTKRNMLAGEEKMKRMNMHLIRRSVLTLGLTLLLIVLAACGTDAGSTTTGNGSGTAASGTTTTAAVTGAPTTQNCGIVHTSRLQVVPADRDHAKGAEDCFWQAYQQCHPAKLTYSQASLDTAVIHTFSLKSQNGQCVITDALQHQVMPRAPSPAGSFTCTGMTRQNDGLHLTACGSEGNLMVPDAGV